MRLSKVIGAVLVSSMLLAAPAGAQPVDDQLRATARALADEGMAFYEKKQYAEALDRFDRAASIIQAPTITLHAARSLDKLGRLIEAAERYRTCANAPLEDKAPDAFRAAQEAARTELDALKPRIPSIEIAVQGPGAAEATVTLDGKPVPKALIGVKSLVNPGDHKIGAMTETHADLQEISVVEKQAARVVLELAPKSDSNTGQPIEPDKPSKPINYKKVGGYAAIGVGGAVAITGASMGIYALVLDAELTEIGCPNDGKTDNLAKCELPDNLQKGRDYATYGTLGNVLLGAGLVTAGVGIALVVLGSKDKPAPDKATTSLHIEPWVGLGSAGFRGTF